MKTTFYKLPEYYLIILAILAGYSPPLNLNPIFIGIVAILILQIIFKNNISGLLLGFLFFLINLYFLGALLSEYYEFTKINIHASQLLLIGMGIWLMNLVFSATMIYKYLPNIILKSSKIKS